ncbi:MAG: hypothetical protein QOI35_584 [Cryptosporangiaceae bacterium]|nr:hypothetical protein [Cryptosporangiaceae bacterium]
MPDLTYLLWLLTTRTVLVSTAFWIAVTALAYRPLARRLGPPRLPTALALMSFAVIAVVVFTPPVAGHGGLDPSHTCLAVSRTELTEAITHFGRGIQEKLNILMLVPLGFFGALATRRPGRWAVAMLAFPAVVETIQGSVIGRFCSPLDWTDNAAGGLIGVAAAVAFTAARRRGTATSRPVAPRMEPDYSGIRAHFAGDKRIFPDTSRGRPADNPAGGSGDRRADNAGSSGTNGGAEGRAR